MWSPALGIRNISIRRLESDEAETLRDLMPQLEDENPEAFDGGMNWSHSAARIADKWTAEGNATFVAFEQGRPCGIAYVKMKDPDTACLSTIGTLDAAPSGLGVELLDKVIEWACKRSAQQIKGGTPASNACVVPKFFKPQGFRVTKQDNYEIIFARNLECE